MNRRGSYSQRVFPATDEFTSRLEHLRQDAVREMLGFLWAGFDRFKSEVINHHPEPSRADSDLERDLTELLCLHVVQVMLGGLPYCLMHEKKERESAVSGAQPPEPDLSFVSFSNPRSTFAIDAKVVEKDNASNVSDYVDTVKGRFLSCVYAPFSQEGAMIAFFLSGSIKTLLQHIRKGMSCTLSRQSYFKGRCHKTSKHNRTALACRHRQFTCHHLVMVVGTAVTA